MIIFPRVVALITSFKLLIGSLLNHLGVVLRRVADGIAVGVVLLIARRTEVVSDFIKLSLVHLIF